MIRTLSAGILGVLLIATTTPALEIASVAPTRATPDTRVILSGGDFTPQSRIFLGEQYVPPIQVLPRQLEFVVPPLPPGSYSLTVQDDTASAVQAFTFEVLTPPPQIHAVEPRNLDFCADQAGRTIRVVGRNFQPQTQLLLNGMAVGSRFLDAAAVAVAVAVDQQRPGQTGLGNVLTGEEIVLESHHRNGGVKATQFSFPLAQLREMPPAGESAEVAVEDQQQPAAAIVVEPVGVSAGVGQGEGDGGLAGQIGHGVHSSST